MVAVTNESTKENIMSDSPETHTNTSNKAPTHIAYQVRGKQGEKSYFTRIGAAWPNKSGNGFRIQLDAVPLDGRFTVIAATEKQDK